MREFFQGFQKSINQSIHRTSRISECQENDPKRRKSLGFLGLDFRILRLTSGGSFELCVFQAKNHEGTRPQTGKLQEITLFSKDF